jgi:hypothetical protein
VAISTVTCPAQGETVGTRSRRGQTALVLGFLAGVARLAPAGTGPADWDVARDLCWTALPFGRAGSCISLRRSYGVVYVKGDVIIIK